MPETYCYRRLSGSNYIRVLDLKPALRASSALRGKLIEVHLSDEPQNRPKYEALSYVWGSPKGDRPILCESKEIFITENCEAALRQLRHQYRRRLLWIDAICIDQSHVPERNQQVEMMRFIYREADHVRVWLGSPSVDGSSFGLRSRLSLKTSEAIFKRIPSPWDSELHEYREDPYKPFTLLTWFIGTKPLSQLQVLLLIAISFTPTKGYFPFDVVRKNMDHSRSVFCPGRHSTLRTNLMRVGYLFTLLEGP